MFDHKLCVLPPHIRAQLTEHEILQNEVLGDVSPLLRTIQMQAAARTEEAERSMYSNYQDDPYEYGKDEEHAVYSVDAINGKVQQFIKSKKTSWDMLQ